jgi:hypothetical protein
MLYNYADDNTLTKFGKDKNYVIDSLKQETENAIKWFNSNHIKASPDKFQVMFLCPSKFSDTFPDFHGILDIQIIREPAAKLLGVIIDDKLLFDKHVHATCVKASRQLNALYRLKRLLSFKQRKALYQCFFLSNFNFCPLVWHFCSVKSTRKMEKLQERALRFLLNDHLSSYENLLSKSGNTTLFLSRVKLFAIEIFKCFNGYNPDFIASCFSHKKTNYDFRDNFKAILPIFNTKTYGKKCFMYYGAHLWNHVPAGFKNAASLDIFKNFIKTWEGPRCQCSLCNLYVT